MAKRVMLFEMPFGVDDPVLANPELGIVRLERRGRRHTFAMDTTVLDTPDHRLLRAGVVLAHRVVDGLGQWFLGAPSWQPWLPTGATEDLGAAGDLPQQFASLVRPFRRRAALGPVAALHCDRREWQLMGAGDEVLGRLRDDRTTIRRGGLTTARYREVTVESSQKRLTADQRTFLSEALLALGGARVDAFPTLAERIGAPATGLTDFRGPFDLDAEASFEQFVGWLFARRLDALMRADLSLRSGQADDLDALREQLADLRREVRSLSFALEPVWRAELEKDIQTVLDRMASRSIHTLDEEYFAVLDALVQGVRAPKIGDLSHQQASEVLGQQTVAVATILLDRARNLSLASGDDRWSATLASAQQMLTLAVTDRVVFGKRARQAERLLEGLVEHLQSCQSASTTEPSIDLDWDVVTAFQEGRLFERHRQEVLAARRAFLDGWPAIEKRVHKARKAR